MSVDPGLVDRVEVIRSSSTMTGIDFVQVAPSQTELLVYLHHRTLPAALRTALEALPPSSFLIEAVGRVDPPRVAVTRHLTPIPSPEGRPALHLLVAHPGGFGDYRLTIASAAMDAYFNGAVFSFKAGCDSSADCAGAPCCAEAPGEDYPVDYRGRDFWGMRQALLDLAAQRFPDWQDRLAADVGMVVTELIAALGDEFAYAQDRIAREFHLETASQRRSLRHLARLVDYEVDDGCAATVWLDVTALAAGPIPGGAVVTDALAQVAFEIGRGLRTQGQAFAIDPDRNSLLPYLWDENNACLPAGSTSLTLQGHHAASLATIDPLIDARGRWVLLWSQSKDAAARGATLDPGAPERRLLVRVVDAHDGTDALLAAPITTIRWDAPLPEAVDLPTLCVRGNLLPATSGRTQTLPDGSPLRFSIGPAAAGQFLPRAIERIGWQALAAGDGDDGSRVKFLFPLPGSEVVPLAWLEHEGRRFPEVRLECEGDAVWEWRVSLIGEDSAKPQEKVFTLEDGHYRRLVGHETAGRVVELVDYAGSAGKTLRFGDREFGMSPAEGAVFQVLYRLGNGRLMNVAPDTLTRFETPLPGLAAAVTNPLAATGGRDPESVQSIRVHAPEAYKSIALRAVRQADYRAIAESLGWVQRAGAAIRWTGSWPTVFVTPDAVDEIGLSQPHRDELEHLLDRVRQAGRQTRVRPPRYADIDLRIAICVEPAAPRDEVQRAAAAALFGAACGSPPRAGFFDEDHFTFGTPLSRAALMAAVQAVAGVKAVKTIEIRRRGRFDWRSFSEAAFPVGLDEVVRVTDRRGQGGQGSVLLVMEGGS